MDRKGWIKKESTREGGILISKLGAKKVMMLQRLSMVSLKQHYRINPFKYQMSYVALQGKL